MGRKIHRLFLSLLCIVLASGVSSAQNLRDFESEKARLESEIRILDRQISEVAQKSRSELSKLTLLRARTAGRRALVAESDRRIRSLSDEIYSTQRQINRLNARLDTLSDKYSDLVRAAYKYRDARMWYMYILASDDLGQAFRRYGYLKRFSDQMKVQADNIRETRKEAELQKENLGLLKAEAEKVRKDRAEELKELELEEDRTEAVVAALKKNKTAYEKELGDKKKEVDALDREIKRIIQEAMKSSGNKGNASKEIDYRLSGEFSKNKGKLPWPVSGGAVVDRFGQHYHPVFRNVKLPFNNGVTLAVDESAEVRAVFEGVVKQIVVMPGYNQCVLVQHGNYFSFYCKLKTTSVKPGEKVKTGQKIGNVDTINGETQLHFQIWQGSTPQNPETWLRSR